MEGWLVLVDLTDQWTETVDKNCLRKMSLSDWTIKKKTLQKESSNSHPGS